MDAFGRFWTVPENVALSPQQLVFVDALLQGMNLGKAARYAKASYTSGRRWWKDPEVQAEFDERRFASRDLATARLQEVSLDAVQTLVGLLDSPDERIQRAAADAILKHKHQSTEQGDLLGALSRLVEQLRGVGPDTPERGPAAGGDAGAPPQPPDALPG